MTPLATLVAPPTALGSLQALGWLANACFFSRFFVQWALSERAGRVRTPRVFWRLSLAGSVLLALYLLQQGERVLLVGAAINALIYWRNLALGERTEVTALARPMRSHLRTAAFVLPAAGLLLYAALGFPAGEGRPDAFWLGWSLVAQALWSSRFIVQWWLAEQRGHSHLPPVFWWMSLAGNGMLLAYAIERRDAVLIVGLSTGPLVPVRNLILGARRASARPRS